MFSKALQCADVFEDRDLEAISIKRLDTSSHRAWKIDGSYANRVSLHDLEFRATSILNLQDVQQGF